MRTRLLPGMLAIALAAGACVTDDDPSSNGFFDDDTDLSSDDIILTAGALQTVDSCGALLDRLVAEGVERVGPYGFGGAYYGGPIAIDVAEEAMAADGDDSGTATTQAANTSGGDDGGSRFSGTNNQEVDVEEADLVKTDGERLLVLNGNTLRVIDVTGSSPRLIDTIQLDDETWATEMFLVGDTALLLSQGWTARPFLSDARDIAWPDGSPTSKIVEVDLDRGRVGQVIEFEGSYLSAREVDGAVRVVLSSGIGRFPFLYPSNPGAEDAATEANRRLIEDSTIEQWIPTYRVTNGGEVVAEGQAIDCDRMHLPSEHAGFGALSILTIDLDDGLTIDDAVGVVSDGQTVYASTDRLTVTTTKTPQWDWETGEPIEEEDAFSTSIHTFDITSTSRTTYVASGEVRGSLLSQYSLSEHDGYLRVATTDGSPWFRDGNSESFVTIFAERDGELRQTGQVGGLGKGEQIFSVRFVGDTAYVVTFRQIDPLYTVDLSDPDSPRVLGELKIPGFSTYLHPLANDLLIGVGQDATDEGRTTGSQISLFDVSDLSDPQRIDTLGLGQDSYSSIDWDPKAFLSWPDEDLIVVPVSWWRWDEETNTEDNGAAAVVVEVDPGGTLREVGRISHPTDRQCETYYLEGEEVEPIEVDPGGDAEAEFAESDAIIAPEEEYCWTQPAEIRRSVVIDDQIYTISEAGVAVNDLGTLDRNDWLPFAR